MLVRGMGIHLINDHLEPETVGVRDQAIEVLQRAEHRIDATVVLDVVAKILHWRRKERRQPDAVDTETGDMIQSADDARQIADAVSIAVRKTARVDLVDDGSPPPVTHGNNGCC